MFNAGRGTVRFQVLLSPTPNPNPNPNPTPNPDQVEALYDFKSCLASGGTGSVWRAVDRRTGEAVAIKVIDKKKLNPALFNMEVFAMQR